MGGGRREIEEDLTVLLWETEWIWCHQVGLGGNSDKFRV